jgi:hypothetical protein
MVVKPKPDNQCRKTWGAVQSYAINVGWKVPSSGLSGTIILCNQVPESVGETFGELLYSGGFAAGTVIWLQK